MIHFLAMVLLAACVSVVFGVVGRATAREQWRYGLRVFAEFVGVGLGLAWLLYWIP